MLALKHRQRGVSLVIAIFILVVLAMLGAAMINILAGGSESVAREVISARALFAAESGAQRKLVEIFPPGDVTDETECDSDTYWDVDPGGIQGCSNLQVDVVCTPIPVSGPINYFTITSTATCGPTGSEAVRVIQIQARDGL